MFQWYLEFKTRMSLLSHNKILKVGHLNCFCYNYIILINIIFIKLYYTKSYTHQLMSSIRVNTVFICGSESVLCYKIHFHRNNKGLVGHSIHFSMLRNSLHISDRRCTITNSVLYSYKGQYARDMSSTEFVSTLPLPIAGRSTSNIKEKRQS